MPTCIMNQWPAVSVASGGRNSTKCASAIQPKRPTWKERIERVSTLTGAVASP